jgi:hypothetical protein
VQTAPEAPSGTAAHTFERFANPCGAATVGFRNNNGGEDAHMNGGGLTFPENDFSIHNPAHSPMSAAVSELMLLMQAVTEQYSMSVHSAVKELVERAHKAIQIDGTMAGISMSRYRIKNAEREFDEKILDATSRLDSHRQWFLDEIRSLDRMLESTAPSEIRAKSN